MDDEDNDYEIERQRTIAENRALLDSLGLDPTGASKIPGTTPIASSKLAKPSSSHKPPPSKRRKVEAVERPTRRSGRIAGFEASVEEVAKNVEKEEKEREVLRVISRRTREKVMGIGEMVEESSPSGKDELESYLTEISKTSNPRPLPSAKTTSSESYADSDTKSAALQALKSQFQNMHLRANAKVTTERVYSMVVHPERTKNLVFVGDKNGMLGIWDALGQSEEMEEGGEVEEGRVWQVQAHARSAITSMKVDPINGSGVFTSSYDCSLRHLTMESLKSEELYALPDENMLITHFDLTPSGQEAWIADKDGGINHCDFREGKRGGRRWVVQDQGRAAKLGGISVNPLMPHLVVTAGNDQHLRIWDVRHLQKLSPTATDEMHPPTPPPTAIFDDIKPDTKPSINGSPSTYPSSSIPYERVETLSSSAKGKGLLRASWQHGKSCSAAYWDPWGRRVLTTSYDDKLRIWTLNPQSLLLDQPLAPTHFQPSKSYPHNCQTGRWLTILRAQWSLNMDYMPHFTVGNMKRSLDVITANGDKIVSLWTDAVTAVPAVTASHPGKVDCVIGGNTSGRIQLWMSGEA